MRIAFLGLGLIGGSIVRALRVPAGAGDPRDATADGNDAAPNASADASGTWHIAAWTPGGSGPRAALERQLIDAAPGRAVEALEGAELVVLAAPPIACLELLGDLAGPLRGALHAGAVITDVASTKQQVVDRAASLGLRFVGGHPMAGLESSGFAASDPVLFRDRPWIIVPSSDIAAVERVQAMVRACGARPLPMAADDHDAAVAAVSHLPLVLSVALVEAVAGRVGQPRAGWSAAAPLAAGGWRSMTRLAGGNVEMGAGIAATNAPQLAARLHTMRDVIDAWLALLEAPTGPDEVAIRDRLASARRIIDGPGHE
jgi:prephenate dehydrogenase